MKTRDKVRATCDTRLGRHGQDALARAGRDLQPNHVHAAGVATVLNLRCSTLYTHSTTNLHARHRPTYRSGPQEPLATAADKTATPSRAAASSTQCAH